MEETPEEGGLLVRLAPQPSRSQVFSRVLNNPSRFAFWAGDGRMPSHCGV